MENTRKTRKSSSRSKSRSRSKSSGKETSIYTLLGHGQEEGVAFEDRPVVPDGYTIVTLAMAGTVTRMPEVCAFLKLFSNESNEPLLSNPLANKKGLLDRIGVPMHVYKSGQKMPALTVSPLAFWHTGYEGSYSYQIIRSGLQQFPLSPTKESRNVINLSKIEGIVRKFKQACDSHLQYYNRMPGGKISDTIIESVFESSLYPTIEQVKSKKHGSLEQIAFNFKKPLLEIITKFPPGVYYYIICRADNFVLRLESSFETYLPDYSVLLDYGAKNSDAKEWGKMTDEIKTRIHQEPDYIVKALMFIHFLKHLPPDMYNTIDKGLGGLNPIISETEGFIEKYSNLRAKSNNQQIRIGL